MSVLASARSYPSSQISDYSFHVPADQGLDPWSSQSFSSSSVYASAVHYSNSPPIRVNSTYAHSHYQPPYPGALRHHSSSPAMQQYYAQEYHAPSNARHQCTYCGKKFSRPSGLKIHLTTHTGDKREPIWQYFFSSFTDSFLLFQPLSALKKVAVVHLVFEATCAAMFASCTKTNRLLRARRELRNPARMLRGTVIR